MGFKARIFSLKLCQLWGLKSQAWHCHGLVKSRAGVQGWGSPTLAGALVPPWHTQGWFPFLMHRKSEAGTGQFPPLGVLRAGRGSEQPGPVGVVPAHGKGLGLVMVKAPFQPKPFNNSMIPCQTLNESSERGKKML